MAAIDHQALELVAGVAVDIHFEESGMMDEAIDE